jgi:hypothetical protein
VPDAAVPEAMAAERAVVTGVDDDAPSCVPVPPQPATSPMMAAAASVATCNWFLMDLIMFSSND